ncbi:DUF305 domain-containing protein [Candidatus Uhrbacteria bacterium]|nr:DUF305 domain-containing protein [Candidatus Uhrbacteria bacterium]
MKTPSTAPWAPVAIGAFILFTFFVGWFAGSVGWFTPSASLSMRSPRSGGMMHGSGGGMMGHAEVKTDAEFLMQMIPHHQEAVDTSRYVLDRTDDPELQAFLQGIIDAQTQEIAQMKSWHREWFGTEYRDDGRYQAMMPNLNGLSDARLVPAYLHGMVMHHMGAIDMARQLLGFTERTELVSFAEGVIQVQTEEIGWMLNWLRDGFGGGTPMMMH